MMKIILLLLFLSCSTSPKKKGALVIDNPEFMAIIDAAKKAYYQKDYNGALAKLSAIDDQKLPLAEKAVRRNMMGVVFFGQGNYEKAAFNFELASSSSQANKEFNAQINLNLGSTYFKIGAMDRALKALNRGDVNYLSLNEFNNYHKLRFEVAKRLGKQEISLASLIYLLGDEQDITKIRNNRKFGILKDTFFNWDFDHQLAFLKSFANKENFTASYLAYLMLEKVVNSEDRKKEEFLLDFVQNQYGSHTVINEMIGELKKSADGEGEMDPQTIGFVLPLSGSRAEFGTRILYGLGSAIKEFQDDFNVVIADSQGSGAVGAFRVREFIIKNKCAAIVGGLFPDEATEEYLEAKRNGVFFISLAPVNLSKEEKNYLLLEIPGSIESQIYQLFKPEMLKKFGNRTAIFYPKGDLGNSYANEFWRKAKESNVEVTGIVGYEESNYLKSLENLLGLAFKRERQEELDFLSKVYAQEKTSARRLQTLSPQVDFDWVFIPTTPNDALKIIPAFSYLDASNINFIGGPAFRSGALIAESKRLGTLYFVGDDVASKASYNDKFYSLYNKRPKLLEMEAFDAMEIIQNILIKQGAKSRGQLRELLNRGQVLKGLTGKWILTDGVWLKDMASFAIDKENIENLFESKAIN